MWIAIMAAVVVGTMMVEMDSETARFVLGAAAGALAILVHRLRSESQRQRQALQSLEQRLMGLEKQGRAPSEVVPEAAPAKETPRTTPTDTPAKEPRPAYAQTRSTEPQGDHGPRKPSRPAVTPSPIDPALRWIRRWLTTGNVPVKVGVLISFFGVSFLLKYAADQNYLTVPIEFRLMGVGLAALGALYFGWHQRARRPVFALSLQGGAIGVLFLTVFAAFQIYAVLPALVAFGLLVLFTAATGVLALLQNAMALAVLGVVGGFLAPVLISTGSGSHVALFSYYALLNGAVFGVAWFRPWRVLNLIGFVFTFVIGTAWGFQYYQPHYFTSVEPFLVLFFLMYLGISMAYALGRSLRLKSYVDSSLVFGLPLVVFPLQKQLVEHFEYGTAVSAAVLAAIYGAAATVLLRSRLKARVRLLGEAYIALGLGFATLAVPLAVSAHWTALTWALEGAAMVWLGSRQARRLPSAAGALLQLGAGVAFLLSLIDADTRGDWLFLNEAVLGGVILAMAGLASARWLERNEDWRKGTAGVAAWVLFGWGLSWWFATLFRDIVLFVRDSWVPTGGILLLAGTAVAMVVAQRRLAWHKVRVVLSAYLPLLLLTAAFWLERSSAAHYLDAGGWLAWPMALAALAMLFRCEHGFPDGTRFWQRAMSVWLLALLVLKEIHWATGALLTAGIWAQAAVIIAAAGMHLVSWRLWRAEQFAVHAHHRDWSLAGMGPVLGVAALGALSLLATSSADPAPLFYLPLLNPLSLSGVVVAIAVAHWLRLNQVLEQGREPWLRAGLSGFALLLVTSEVTRTVHHWTGVPFQAEALFESVRVQASLSVAWALSALAVMVFGHRRAQRVTYLCGAALMAVVVGKLFLVDLAQSDTLERIVSFIGVGLLLLAVGFLAPVPPKRVQKRVTSGAPS